MSHVLSIFPENTAANLLKRLCVWWGQQMSVGKKKQNKTKHDALHGKQVQVQSK